MLRCGAHVWTLLALAVSLSPILAHAAATNDAATYIPAQSPRTGILAGKRDAFRHHCLNGEGSKSFSKIKADFDKTYADLPFPAEPVTYGDPEPKRRDSAKADKWRATQDPCGLVS